MKRGLLGDEGVNQSFPNIVCMMNRYPKLLGNFGCEAGVQIKDVFNVNTRCLVQKGGRWRCEHREM